MRKDLAALRHVAHAATRAPIGAFARDVVALEPNAAGARRQQADDAFHERALADPVAAEHTDDLAGCRLETLTPCSTSPVA